MAVRLTRLSRDGPAVSTWWPVQRDRAGVFRDPANADYLGCEFDDRDTTQSPPVAVVNETLARRLWPEGRWIGSTVIIDNTPREVVGVVADVSMKSRNEPAEPWTFAPYWQNPGQIDSRIAVLRQAIPRFFCRSSLARCIALIGVPIAETITLPVRMAGLTRPVRVAALFVGYAASLAMLLTAIGLDGALCIRGGAADERDWHPGRARRRACAARRIDRAGRA